jgi:3-ketosteroid 9alpha-monooxygenase subunit A
MSAVIKPNSIPTPPMHKIEAAPLPARYARGWHCLGLASEYKDGKPHSINIFGTRLVIYQGASGKLNILNAWCPHMGADLGLGEVKGESVVCRFHGWNWGADGVCNHIPYSKRIPPKARIKTWPSSEENNLLFVWNDPEGNPPTGPVRPIPETKSAEWSGWSMVKWTINTNCRELVDNQADMTHFGPVHGSTSVVYFSNIFEGDVVTQIMVGANERLGGANNYLTTIATYMGPAYHVTHMYGEAQGVPIESLLLNTHTPIDTNSFELRFGVMVKKIPGLTDEQNEQMIKSYVDLTNKAFGEDVQIWHNKVRIDNPLLCEGDGPIYQLRQWYGQFYVDAAEVPADTKLRKVIETNSGIEEGKKPASKHVFEL